MMKNRVALMLFCLFFASQLWASATSIRYFQTDARYTYHLEILKLALDKTVNSEGPYQLEAVHEQMTQPRGLQFLKSGKKIDIAFIATNIEREQQLRAIKIPILRGLLGYRVLLIHQDTLQQFANISTFEQLKQQYTAGFGAHWADLSILKHNGIRVDETVKYKLLFMKLNSKRFDYFPRGINEAWKEIAIFSSQYPSLIVDPHLAFYYPYPVYFFVNKDNTQLAQRVERGLTTALNDGSFKALFNAHHEQHIKQANLASRKTFLLHNPSLPANTPPPDTSWWLDSKSPRQQ